MTTRQKMNAHTLTTCTNMRKAGIELYVVGYGVAPGSSEESFLKSCAGGRWSTKYYYTVDDSTLESAMKAIELALDNLRLAS